MTGKLPKLVEKSTKVSFPAYICQHSSPEGSERATNNSASNSDDSQDISSYFVRRKTYKRATSTKPPPNESADSAKQNSPLTSTVEFITQFSDMESVSENGDDPNHAKKHKELVEHFKDLPLQGCESKPENEDVQLSTASVGNEKVRTRRRKTRMTCPNRSRGMSDGLKVTG